VARLLAEGRAAWKRLEELLANTYGLEGTFHFMYGPRYGWALRFRRGDRLILAMYPNRGYLTVQVILGRAQVAAATAMSLPTHVSRALARATDYPEGRWLFVPVRSVRAADALQALIVLKMARPKRSVQAGQPGGRRRSG
jgi:hypothetical protein